MVTATGCRAETARGWSRPRAVSQSGHRPSCSVGSQRRGCSPSRSSVADEGGSEVSGSCCTGTKMERRCVHLRDVVPFVAGGHDESARYNEHTAWSSNSPRIVSSYYIILHHNIHKLCNNLSRNQFEKKKKSGKINISIILSQFTLIWKERRK